MTGPLCFLQMCQRFALTLPIDVLECGEHVTNVLHQFVSLNKTLTAKGLVMVWAVISMQGKTDLHIIEKVH